ncbi:MAG: hydroxymethylglutaryl-CoA lyase [Halieaceae bacterium]|jgi:hydroxymethylglutaryl-CoA lyase|nr:hydroxymethylglutaryl-CoA lyase [Halieaceae bacterium]
MPERVTLVEVGPRDGLQNESTPVSTEIRVALVNRLAAAGLPVVETGSFVNPKWVPQMASSEAVFEAITRRAGTRYTALTPNMRGFERALAAGADEVAVFAAASEGFSQKNINCSIDESLARFRPVTRAAAEADIPVRGYISCVIACPFDGPTSPALVREVSDALLDMGCYEVSLGDTTGVGSAGSVSALLGELLRHLSADKLALHCHDTYGQALANILVGLQHGIATFDASVAGLGGCPYAPGATGNVATEDVLYMLNGLNIETGVDATLLREAGEYITRALGRPNQSRAANALRTRSQ